MQLPANGNDPAKSGLTRFRWSVDHCAINDEGVLLIFGWAMHDSQEIVVLRAVLRFIDGSRQEFHTVYGTEREDVADSANDNPRALSCGFYFFGRTHRTDIASLSLEVTLANGECTELPTHSMIAVNRRDAGLVGGAHRGAVYRHLVVRALQLIRVGRFGDLLAATHRHLRGTPRPAANGMAKVRSMAAAACGGAHLIVDHDLGGGANQFRHSLTRELVSNGATIVILTFHVPTLRYVFECCRHGESIRFAVDPAELLRVLSELNLCRVHWNNAVSFTRQVALLDAVTSLSRSKSVPTTYYLHDYHSICPSHALLDKDGQYCGVPSIDLCMKCLPEMRDGLASLFAERDICLWRRRWDAFLTEADEIVYFSRASMALLMRAYPQLARHPGLKFRPHDISDFVSRPSTFELASPLNIGVVGRISMHKGAQVVWQMAEAIERSGMEASITVLGVLDGIRKPRTVTITGSYKRNELSGLVAQHNVNMVAFTSIWPETFSYVVAEVMSLGLPIVCFDLGAPAERVRSYKLGRVVPLGDGRDMLEAAMALRNDLLRGVRPS